MEIESSGYNRHRKWFFPTPLIRLLSPVRSDAASRHLLSLSRAKERLIFDPPFAVASLWRDKPLRGEGSQDWVL
jgi:hypothetical protein